MQANAAGAGRKAEDEPDVARSQLLPRIETQELLILVREVPQGDTNDRFGFGRAVASLRQKVFTKAVGQRIAPALTAPLIGRRSSCRGEEPEESWFALRHLVDATPRREKRFSDHVGGIFGVVHPSQGVGEDACVCPVE